MIYNKYIGAQAVTANVAAGEIDLAVGVWIDTTPETYQPAEPSGTLWEAMQIVPVEEPA